MRHGDARRGANTEQALTLLCDVTTKVLRMPYIVLALGQGKGIHEYTVNKDSMNENAGTPFF